MNTRNAELIGRAKRILTENICKDSSYPWGETPMMEPGKGWGGIWNWDSAFHAVGALHFDEELAKTQIRGFLNFCADDGSLPDVVWENGEIERRFSKPPRYGVGGKPCLPKNGRYSLCQRRLPRPGKKRALLGGKQTHRRTFPLRCRQERRLYR